MFQRRARSLGRPRLIFLLILIELVLVLAPWAVLSVAPSPDGAIILGSGADGGRDLDSKPEEAVLAEGGESATVPEPPASLPPLVITSVLPVLTFLVLFLVVIRRHPRR